MAARNEEGYILHLVPTDVLLFEPLNQLKRLLALQCKRNILQSSKSLFRGLLLFCRPNLPVKPEWQCLPVFSNPVLVARPSFFLSGPSFDWLTFAHPKTCCGCAIGGEASPLSASGARLMSSTPGCLDLVCLRDSTWRAALQVPSNHKNGAWKHGTPSTALDVRHPKIGNRFFSIVLAFLLANGYSS